MAEKDDLARLSYAEVLDATKHQDDKIGRILGAIAFFVGGALAGKISGDKVEIGLVPWGSLGMGLLMVSLATVSTFWGGVLLLLAALYAGSLLDRSET